MMAVEAAQTIPKNPKPKAVAAATRTRQKQPRKTKATIIAVAPFQMHAMTSLHAPFAVVTKAPTNGTMVNGKRAIPSTMRPGCGTIPTRMVPANKAPIGTI